MPGLRSGHQVDLLVGGAEFFPALIAAMDAAQSTVHLETYIFHQDAAGQSVLDALTRAAARGLTVTLVVDDVGTPQWSPGWQTQLQKSGVQWQRFSPLGSLGLLIPGRWRRLHRKLCVVDGQLAFCGGINILDDHFELDHGPQAQARFDFAVRVRGPLVAEVQAAMLQFWWRLDLVRQLGQGHIDPLRRSWEAGAWGPAQGSAASRRAQGGAGGMRAALLLRDNLRHRRRIERAYRQAIARAKTEVLIANAYFLPGIRLRRALVHAAQRGVRVRLLLQGRYEFFMQYHAARPFYGALLDAGVEIHEYQAGFLHAKVAVIDGRWATVGSSNLDPLSLLLAREANVVVEDTGFARSLSVPLQTAIARDSVQMDKARFSHRPLGLRLKDYLAYSLLRLSLFLSGKDY